MWYGDWRSFDVKRSKGNQTPKTLNNIKTHTHPTHQCVPLWNLWNLWPLDWIGERQRQWMKVTIVIDRIFNVSFVSNNLIKLYNYELIRTDHLRKKKPSASMMLTHLWKWWKSKYQLLNNEHYFPFRIHSQTHTHRHNRHFPLPFSYQISNQLEMGDNVIKIE